MALSHLHDVLDTSPAAGGLLRRQDTCGNIAGMAQCSGSFPPNFCCPSSSTCFGFNSNKSVICCPNGSNCDGIAPTSCDLQFYNATAHPESPMHLSDLDTALKPCGGGSCCPSGYTCNAKNFCVLNALASATAAATSTATAATLTGSVTSTPPTATPTNTAAAGASNPQASTSSPTFTLTGVLVGAGAGLAGGILLTLLIIWCIGLRTQKRRAAARDDDSLGPVAAKVSDPIYLDAGATRTDFLRYASKSRRSPAAAASSGSSSAGAARRWPGAGSTPASPGGAGSPGMGRVRSLFSRTPTLGARARWERVQDEQSGGPHEVAGGGAGARRAEMEQVRTPPRQTRPREPSTESIKIYSPPDARELDRQTTFGDVLKAAGARDEVPAVPPLNFMGSPGLVDPRSRGVDAGKLR